MACDPKFSDVVLLLSMDGADNATVFVDSSPAANTVTAQGDARLETSSPTPKFGIAAGFFDGAGDYLSMPMTADLDLSSGAPFTLEGWFFLPSVASSTSQLLLGCRDVTNTSGYTLALRPDTGLLSFQMFGAGGASCTASASVSAGSWYSFALVWDGTNFTAFIDGVPGTTPVSAGPTFTPFAATELRVGADVFSGITGNYWPGSLDEFRITNGTARYSTNYAPATEPFPLITCEPVTCDDYYDQVGVLLPLTGPNGGTTFGDDSSNALTVTPSGDVQTLNTNGDPWGPGSAADFGSATVGALDVPFTADGPLDIGGVFTLEFWFRVDPSVTDDFVLADIGDYAAGSGLLVWADYSAGHFTLSVSPGANYTGSGWSPAVFNDVILTRGVWYQFTFVRTGKTASVAVNGVFDGVVSNWIGTFLPATKFRFGNMFVTPVSAPFAFKGQMSDIRVTKNIARYDGVTRFDAPLDYYPAGQCAAPCDPAYDSVVALLQMDAGSFDDVLGATLTPTGSAAVSSAQAIAPNTSSFRITASGTGNTNYLQIVNSDLTAYQIAAGEDFTIEVWAYGYTPTGAYPWLLGGSVDQGVTGWWGIQLNPAGGYVFWHGDGFSSVSDAGAWITGAWNHVAVSRTGSQTTVYVNGKIVRNPFTQGQAIGLADGTMYLGRNNQPFAGDNANFNGHYQSFRFTKGVGRYPGPFSVETPNFPDFVCGVQCDDEFANVSTLLTMDGTAGSTSFPDDSNNALTWTSNNGAVVETSLVKFGTGALNPNNAGGGFLRSPFVPGGPLDIAGGDFTLEFWFRAPNTSSLLGLLNYGNALSSQGFRIYVNSGGITVQCLLTGWNSLGGPFNIEANTWYHLAVVRKGSEGKCFLNGFNNNAQSMLGAPTITGNVDIGTNQFGSFDGVIDEWRLTKGVARYWNNFMPPQQPFGLVCIGTVPVPDVEGDTLAAATVAIEAVGLVAGTVTYEFDGGHAFGTVIETDPVAGSDVLIGSTVDIVVSLGTEVIVPDLVGLDQTAATAALTSAGLIVGTIGVAYSEIYPIDIVVTQDPPAGESVSEGSSVDFQLSLGPAPVTVPNVVTFSLADATIALATVSLIPGAVSNANSDEIEAGHVISQSPFAGSTVLVGTAVALVISIGPLAVVVPDVVGMTSSDAANTLSAAFLRVGRITVDVSGTFPLGTIASQDANAGALVPSGTKINLVLSAIAPPFDVDATVISQYSQSPTLVELVESMAAYIDPRTNLTLFYSYVWNVDTAQGFGLDVWGRIVGIGRLLRITGDDPTFGFDNDSDPPDWQPWSQGRFARGGEDGEAVILDDGAYRILILVKALANITATSAASINALLRNLFPGRGNPYVEDLGGMAMRFVFDFKLTPVEYAIVSQSGALPHPAGVSFSVTMPP